ncbi:MULTISPECIES: hypothetical protein [Rhizobium]|uniref:Nuclease n=1 Tax=Rhizobium leguminosarum TaxID=384 RepID=A0A1B1CP37_RHILE|nr:MULTISPECIES: hypothetical protein [Rhizobium]ANP91533.1 hypothetical protein BA011_36095 [Rhizobium leguminosarum]API56814.1 hypothetical protein BMW22_36010 [Rhizobium leguminosarum]
MRQLTTNLVLAGILLATLFSVISATTVDAKTRPAAVRHIEINSYSVHATYCENSACEPVSLSIASGDGFIMYRWGDHREKVRLANIDAPSVSAKCVREQQSAQLAIERLARVLNGATFTMARLHADPSGTIAVVSVDRHDVGHILSREHVVWPWEPRHRSWC